jgi:hypothetical protein
VVELVGLELVLGFLLFLERHTQLLLVVVALLRWAQEEVTEEIQYFLPLHPMAVVGDLLVEIQMLLELMVVLVVVEVEVVPVVELLLG